MQIWKLLNSWAVKLQGCACGYLLVLYLLQKDSYTILLQKWVLPVGEHNRLLVGTPTKHLFSSHPKIPALRYAAPFITFFLSTNSSYPWILKVLSFMPFWGAGHREDYFVGFDLFSHNAWLLLTVTAFHPFISHWGFLCLTIVFKSKSLIFWCADLLPFHLATVGTVSAQLYWKLASECVPSSMCSLLALALPHLCWFAALVALNLGHWITIHFLLEFMIVWEKFCLVRDKGKGYTESEFLLVLPFPSCHPRS